ncbi:AAA family ATPase [Bradymonas sediminis]|uniref:Uncharacterized protein n=1 Tax=Bradymonas sediminis TaxID=1548548 RepID=A0A2Z4FLD4_9DELT|nr:AAA family ATPase [Bradymonas sediminis]AWV89732.1 hypothetical protein DN745_10425 [Bradymonas sediminis]TDP76523.1 ATP-dependent Clp protease ATP-binding subunit ClpC [Bradymonas sediminis]
MSLYFLELDIVLDIRPHRTTAYLFGEDSLAAVADTPEEAVDRMEQLVEKVAEAEPWRFRHNISSSEQGGAKKEAAAKPPIQMRTMKVSIPVGQRRRLFQATLNLLVATRWVKKSAPKPGENPAGKGDGATFFRDYLEVFLPEVPLQFEVADTDQLELAIREHLCQYYMVDQRLDELSEFLQPAEGSELAADARFEKRTFEAYPLKIRIEAAPSVQVNDQENSAPTLEAVGEPLHVRLAKKDAPRAFERKAEVDTLLNYLSDEWERSVLLVGPPGVGKTAIVYDAVGRMLSAKGKGRDARAVAALSDTKVWQISGGRLMAGMRYLGEWQERVIEVIAEARRTGAILFADNLVELLEASGNEKYANGIPGLLLPHILSGDLVLVSEARPEQLAHIEQRQPSFLRALRRLPVEAMSPAQTDAVLERVSFRLGREHGVRLSAATRQRIIELTGRFPNASGYPGPAVDLAERMARTHRTRGVQAESEDRPELQPEHAIEAFASQTGLPRELLDAAADFDVSRVEKFFGDAIFDQPDAVAAMVDLVAVIRAGLNPPKRPFGSYFFLGPTGVGKTQTALTLARYLFGSEERMVRFDMSEFQDPWSAARLVGRYKGEQGALVRKVREQPFQVILLDEIEKAHSSVFDLLLQVMGEGRITDALGQTVSMTGSVIIMTSNLGSEGPESFGFDAAGPDAAAKRQLAERQHFRSAVEAFFRPEFVGRIDRIIAFDSLGRGTARRLVERALEEALSREGLKRRNIQVRVADPVIEYLIRVGFDERYGARPLRQVVESHITAILANTVSAESGLRDATLEFRMVDGLPSLEQV